jgi:hypothetical protein
MDLVGVQVRRQLRHRSHGVDDLRATR